MGVNNICIPHTKREIVSQEIQDNDTYNTIESPSEGLYKEKGSKFIAYLYPISSPEEVKPLVELLKKEYYDARHHCWAYRLGQHGEVFRSVDDGEPSGTAGRPILGAMQSRDVTNVLCVVIRYFGGIKLGTSGLIVAYKDATFDAIDNAKVVERKVQKLIELNFGYMQINQVMKLLKNTDHRLINQTLENTCQITVEVRRALADEFIARADNIDGLYLEIKN